MKGRYVHYAVAIALGVWAVGGALAAPAQDDRRVKIVNETGVTIVEFYGSNAGTNKWEEDILGADTLPPGQSVVVDFDDGSGYCLFDFRAVFADGDVLIRKGIDVCKTPSYRYTTTN